MNDLSSRGPAGFPLPPSASNRGRERPWWGEIDVLLGVVWYLVAIIIAGIVAAVAVGIGGDDLSEDPIYAVFFGTLVLQICQAAYPWWVSKRKGLGLESDWRFTSSLPGDIGYGFVLALGCLIGAQLATLGAAALVGLEDIEDASNTSILVDSKESLWVFGIVALVVVGAPLAEELLFRGLILRIFEKSFGKVLAVLMSTAMFALPHAQPGATWQESVVLLSAITVVGLVLGVGTIKSGRLGPAVIGHFLFNGAGTLLTLV